MEHLRLYKVQLALEEICRITGVRHPEAAVHEFARRCEPSINAYWLPFYTFRCFFTFELTPAIIKDYRRGNALYREYIPPMSMSTAQVEAFIGVPNLSRLIHIMTTTDKSLIVDHLTNCLRDDEFNILDVGVIYSILNQNQIPTMFIPEIVAASAKSCIGMTVAHLISITLFEE